ncbi:HNH endonuclease [Candidatus Pacearchaeota archaeon]|nr:HNH endonuclease [Candidatus Pacearchaeota archaeon]
MNQSAVKRKCRIVDGEVRVYLTRGKIAIVDILDYEKVKFFNWSCTSHGYASRWCDGGIKYLHHEILSKSFGTIVHVDRDRLNNRRSNLRYATQYVNTKNTARLLEGASLKSRYSGVSWNVSGQRWRSQIWFGGTVHHVKSSACEITCALAYDLAVVEKYGEGDRRLNFSKDDRECLL